MFDFDADFGTDVRNVSDQPVTRPQERVGLHDFYIEAE